MGAIYKITNVLNNKVYIGKTKRQVAIRWQEHLREYKKENNIPLYNAFNKYGINNFIFQILENDVENENLNIREQYYIKLYNSKSHENGYNVTEGGDGGNTSPLLTDEQVNEIITVLLDKTNFDSFNKIGKKYNISGATIRSINVGEIYNKDKLDYPIRKYDSTGINISLDTYMNIIEDLKQNILPIKDIMKKYNISQSKIEAINYGKYCYNKNNLFYKDIAPSNFPIRDLKRQNIDQNLFKNILYDFLFLNKSVNSLGEQYNMNSNTIQYIMNGKRRKDLTYNFKTPINKYKEENKKIYLSIYEKEGGVAQ